MNVPEQWTPQEAEDNSLTDPLGLSKLPLVEDVEDGWPVISAALQQGKKAAHRRRLVGGWLAAAASIALAIGLVVQPGKNPSEPGGTSTLPATNGTELASQQTDTTLDSLIGLSQMVERQVRGLRKEIGSVPTDSLIYMAELEDLVIQVDDQLSQQPDSLDAFNYICDLFDDLGM